jgi:hypothetical protein
MPQTLDELPRGEVRLHFFFGAGRQLLGLDI